MENPRKERNRIHHSLLGLSLSGWISLYGNIKLKGTVIMRLKKAMDINRNIVYLRRALYESESDKKLTDSTVINLSQQLDREIILIQKIIK
jgi:hypothetical protein